MGPVTPKTPVERQMLGLLQKFDRWDDDGSGDLNHSELAAGLVGTTYQPANVLKFYDTTRDGKISLGEAQDGYSRAADAGSLVQ